MKSFKVLTFGGQFIDESLIHNGVYGTSVPVLHDSKMSIDDMIHKYKTNMPLLGFTPLTIADAIANLQRCKLETVHLLSRETIDENNTKTTEP